MSDKSRELACTNCGETVTDKMRICPYCGHALKADAVSQTQPVYQTQPQVIVVPAAQAPAAAPVEEEPVTGRSLLLTFAVWAVAAFAAVYGMGFVAEKYGRYVEPFTPFVGAYSAEAAGVAQNYVKEVYPEFTNAEQTVSAAQLDGEPVYIVDYVLEDSEGLQGLRLVVSRRLDDVYPLEYYDGR
ncbi:MAG: zinc ribbon domain-containing protein [Chloroflexi bacterium]|nr:zinc ribbon domain-containing protein [Chloroflexota bacterium]